MPLVDPTSPRRLLRVVASLTVVGLVLGGCVSPPPKVFTPPPSRQMTAGGGRLDVPLSSDVLTLQPVLTTDETSARVWSLIYLPLLDTDPDNGALRPGLAESYVVSADGKTITFTLRPGLVWSDGEPAPGMTTSMRLMRWHERRRAPDSRMP